jgi:uncharacterized protein (DUF427 family)
MTLAPLTDREPLRLEPTPKWIRARLDGEVVIDSRRARLVRQEFPPIPRTYAFPPEDVSDAVPQSARIAVDGLVAVRWEDMDHWYEESEEVSVHPRDPHKRIDTLQSSRHVVITLDGERLAETRRPVILIESYPHLPIRYYIPHDDVDMTRVRAGGKITMCPYKGSADHYHVRIGGRWEENLAWSYRTPLREVEPIRGLLAFYNERVEVIVDGEPEALARTDR